MSKAVLNSFTLNGKKYTHEINTTSGMTTLEEGTDVLYSVDSDGVVCDRAGRLGKMCTHDNYMYYFECLSGLRIECNSKDSIKSEKTLFEYFLKM